MVNMWNTGEMAGRVRNRRKTGADRKSVDRYSGEPRGRWRLAVSEARRGRSDRGDPEGTEGRRRLTVSVRNRGEKEQLLVTVRNSGRSRPRWRVCRLQVFRSTLD